MFVVVIDENTMFTMENETVARKVAAERSKEVGRATVFSPGKDRGGYNMLRAIACYEHGNDTRAMTMAEIERQWASVPSWAAVS